MASSEPITTGPSLIQRKFEEPTPAPLRVLIDKMHQTLDELAGDVDGRHEIHALRSHLSDICALTETDPKILRAVDKVVKAGDRLGALADRGRRRKVENVKPARLRAATQALGKLDQTLARARPSNIALSLNRGW